MPRRDDEVPHDGEKTLVLQRVSFGVSKDDDLVNNDNTLVVLDDSGSNINIIQQKDIRFWGIPETYEKKPGRLNDIGTLTTLVMIKSVYYHTNFMVYSRRQMNEN